MRFIYNGSNWTEPGVITELAKDTFNQWLIEAFQTGCLWLVNNGVPILAELSLVWGMGCLMISITGKGKWLERGAKGVLISMMLGVAHHAV